MSEFHSRDGFYFSSDRYGNVTVRVAESGQVDAPTARQVTLPPNEWASVVASMCKAGEDGTTYRAALDFHQADGHENS